MKTTHDLRRELSWNTKFYILMTVSIFLLARLTSALETDFAFTMFVALAVLLVVEGLIMISVKYPVLWNYVKWIALALLLQAMIF
ncbi:MAG: hypothetical protein KDC53_08560 [Saprospiraceae bacterium]|nr:hypothetical protein [Saprospiraceae bacterium]